jgi:hypothetical protein
MHRLWLLGVAMFAPACSDSVDVGSGDDAGSGTRTLHVEGEVSGSSNGTSFSTSFTVNISKSGVPVTDAKVTITSRTGHYVLGSDIRFPGKWSHIADGYEQIYVLDVESGADTIRDVRVDGPRPVVFTSPADDSTIDPASPLEVRWEPEAAELTSLLINPQAASFMKIEDSGSFTIPANTLAPNAAGSHGVGLIRTNTVTPAGAVEGSSMLVSTNAFLHVCDRPSTGLCTN